MALRRAILRAPVALLSSVLATVVLLPSATAMTTSMQSSGKTVRWPTPTQVPFDDLVMPSCSSKHFCLAVTNGGAVYRYDGTRWTPTGRVGDQPATGVSCVAKTFCMLSDAAGRVLRFDGTRWTAPRSLTGAPSALSCAPDQTCMVAAPDGHAFQYRDQRWHRTARIIDPSAEQTQYPDSVRDVSCVSAAFCIAVVSSDDSSSDEAFRFDGHGWQQVASPATDPQTVLTHVSCASTHFCVAVDRTNSAMIFDGVSWTAPEVLDPPVYSDDDENPHLLNPLTGLSCWAPDACVTVGAQGFFGRYDGSGWQRTHFATVAFGVSCVAADFCVVSGSSGVQTWDGAKLSAVDDIAPAVLGAQISCARTTFCMVMGPILGGAAVYDGHRLAPSAAVFPDVATKHMTSWPAPSLDCASVSFCVAVDAHEAAMWNGKRWGAPREIDARTLVAVSCASSTLCMAFDDRGRALTYRNRHWSVPRHVGLATAVSVSCARGPICVAVDYTGIARVYRNGKWSVRQDLGSPHGAPFTVACGSTTLCLIANNKGTIFRYRGMSFGHGHRVFHLNGGRDFAMSCVGDTFCAIADVNVFGNPVKSAVWTAGDSWGAKSTLPRPIDPLSDPEDPARESAQNLSCPAAQRCFASYANFVSTGTIAG